MLMSSERLRVRTVSRTSQGYEGIGPGVSFITIDRRSVGLRQAPHTSRSCSQQAVASTLQSGWCASYATTGNSYHHSAVIQLTPMSSPSQPSTALDAISSVIRLPHGVVATDHRGPPRESTPTKPPRIVDDLIPLILESDDHWWPRDLQRLAAVSLAWVGPVRRILYAFPRLQSFHACTLLARTLSGNTHLLTLIRGLDLCPATVGDCSLTEEDMASIRFILNLKGLQSMTLGGQLAVRAERFIQMMSSTHSITSLHIDGSHITQVHEGSSSRYPASLSWDDSIAFRFARSLRTLRLTSLHLSLAEPDVPYALRVGSLILEDVVVDSGSIQDLCHESWSHLHQLSISSGISHAHSLDQLALPLLECCEHLESLRYEACTGAHGELFEEGLPGFSSLRNLCLYDINVNPQTLALLAQTCRSLVQLSVLGRTVRLAAQDWAELLHSGGLPSLRSLETSSGRNIPPSGFLRWSKETCSELQSTCTARGVKLTCS